MPANDNSDITLSRQFADTRVYLLDVLNLQLDELLVDKLKPQSVGVPFINFQNDPPQVVAIKKVINSLYHTEKALEHWESVDTTTVVGWATAAPSLYKALRQVYKSISMLDDATPEIRRFITQNYYVIEPLYSKTYELIKKSGWASEFVELDTTEKASKVIGEGISLLGQDLGTWNQANPLIATFDKISNLIKDITAVQDKDITEQNKKERMDAIYSLLNDLDNNAFIGQLSIADFEDAKAIQNLLNWFKTIQEDGFDFTKNSIEQYVSWANYYLPKLILLADQLERQNYLKPGLLSQHLSSNADSLAQQINGLLDSNDTYDITQRVVETSLLRQIREQHIEDSQIKSVQIIMTAERQQIAAAHFFKILRGYKGKSLSEIIESDRVLLRQAYPQLQIAVAHANLDLENALTEVLNTLGPEKISTEPKSWWQKTIEGFGYVASFVYDYEVNRLLVTESFVDKSINDQISSEQFKITIAEKARDNLGDESPKEAQISTEELSLEQRVSKRIGGIKKNLMEKIPEREVVPKRFVPVKVTDLTNLHGTLTYIQSLKLSTEVRESREAMITLVKRHIAKGQVSEEGVNALSTQVIIDENSEIHEQIKQVEENLLRLEKELAYFEGIDLSWGITVRLRTYIAVAAAANQLKKSVLLLTPDAQKALAPALPQLLAIGSTLSNKDHSAIDLSAVEKLKQSKIGTLPGSPKEQYAEKSTPIVETTKDEKATRVTVDKTTETGATTEKAHQVDAVDYTDYIEKISIARTSLLSRCQSRLSGPIASRLTPQREGLPFIDIDKEPPQVAAIQKMVNSLYYAEAAIKIWKGIDTRTTLGKVAAAHQGVAALSQLYKSFQLFTEAAPEIQNLLRENYDLIKPAIDSAKKLLSEEGWNSQFAGMELTQKVGSIIGQVLVSVQSSPSETTQTASLVRLLSELPALMNNMSNLVGAEEVSVNRLRISEERIDAISDILELVFEENSSFFKVFKGPQAIIGLIDLNKKFQREGTNLQEATIKSYQQWIQERYPDLLVMLDEIETRYYLKPGTLSEPIILEVDKLNDKLNEVIESKPPEDKFKKIVLSSDLAPIRKMTLDIKKVEHWNEVFEHEHHLRAAHLFFDTLRKYEGKSFLDINKEDRSILRENFAIIQSAMANSNLDLSNECVVALNQLETISPKEWIGVKVSIAQIIKQQNLVQDYIVQRHESVLFKIKILDHAINHIKLTAQASVRFDAEEPSVDALQKNYLEALSHRPIVGPGKLEPINSSSLYNVRGNLAYVQELQISSIVAEIRSQCTQITKDKFSSLIQKYLKKQEGQPLHAINPDDPLMVRQIKEVENGLYHLETAFKHFEQFNKSDKLVVQARAVIEIKHKADQLKDILEKLTPELTTHYGPMAIKMLEFSTKIRNIEYNKEDLQDFITVIQSTKKELLKRKPPKQATSEKAFFDSNSPQLQTHPGFYETTGRKATRLGIKYLYRASPSLEEARRYLQSRYSDVFGKQPPIIRGYTRQHLADEKLMHSEISRLKLALQEHYGFNLTTVGVFVDLIQQIQRVGAQTSEVVGMVNQLVTNDYLKIKEDAYKNIITQLSREEDYLCLKPGTLINPAMFIVNQLFLSAALELDMPFNKKMSILDDKIFLNQIVIDTEREIKDLRIALQQEPSNKEIEFKIKIKEDKLLFLNDKIKLFASQEDTRKTKSALLDMQFETYLRDKLKGTPIIKPLLDQYEKAVRAHYKRDKDSFLAAADCAQELYDSIQNFERGNVGNYLIVNEAYSMLHKFSLKLPPQNQELKNYIDAINAELIHENSSIEMRAQKVQSLPNDSQFIAKLSMADEGTSFLMKFTQFLERVTLSIIDAIATGKNVISLYNQAKMKHLMQNIEKTLTAPEVNAKNDVECKKVATEGLNAEREEIELVELDEDNIELDNEEGLEKHTPMRFN
ncbi:hypothetical protein [Legionella brunensis]|uniref:SdhB protein, substrate of the Dot/Icm system n=1 Tax=Legionella brunensis TaxID=29422 RepID=A0A0W0S5M4_9GAMM|nr:hypothetical protein [Legionella brunensis]KTC78393.1 SdhB protein, substrate of the Dot/Icm system [Legionella brunensis]